MDKRFTRRIIKALKLKRQELFSRIEYINETLANLEGTKPAPKQYSALQLNQQRIMRVMSLGKWYTDLELASRAGIYNHGQMRKAIDGLVAEGKLEQAQHGGYPHYRRKSEELRLIAGEGRQHDKVEEARGGAMLARMSPDAQ